ncbi:MAG: pyridoxamine 5'-phosphate oxidase [Verrucomicrobiota bacterium]|nr:pyridoxamine 5'-phosphate oxidase [Verrucomicrobiota bacterium]
MSLADLRREYTIAGLRKKDLSPDPFAQFLKWFSEALAAPIKDANAMVLATADRNGAPSARTVLLKNFNEQGFVFFTNYNSRKGRELAENPKASLVFFWPDLERQVCIRGVASKTTREEAEIYFHSRPLGSQLGAWASAQSESIASRDDLEKQLLAVTARFKDQTIPMPENWGGFRLAPHAIEFWQGRPDRLHDRFVYLFAGDQWKLERLSP